jgi:hypothetical protein
MLKYIATAALVLGLAGAWLATRPAAPKPFAKAYHDALERFPGSEAAIESGMERFAAAYVDLTHDRTGARVRALYADPLYFNDSLKTFRQRDALVDYMQATSDSLRESEVRIDQVLRDGADVFVRWTMEFRAGSMGRAIESRSVGMTHLRFDESGRVVLHQDFWDSAAGLYRNLPVVGYVLKLVDARMNGDSGSG